MRGQSVHNTRPRSIATQFPGHECMDDLTTERSFYSQATWGSVMCLAYLLTCYPCVFIQPGTDKRPADRCRN